MLVVQTDFCQCLNMVINTVTSTDVDWDILINNLKSLNDELTNRNKHLLNIKNIYTDDDGMQIVELDDNTTIGNMVSWGDEYVDVFINK